MCSSSARRAEYKLVRSLSRCIDFKSLVKCCYLQSFVVSHPKPFDMRILAGEDASRIHESQVFTLYRKRKSISPTVRWLGRLYINRHVALSKPRGTFMIALPARWARLMSKRNVRDQYKWMSKSGIEASLQIKARQFATTHASYAKLKIMGRFIGRSL